MDSLGNILAAYSYHLNGVSCQNIVQDLEITHDKGVVAWGYTNSIYALRIDSLGTPLWSKQFTGINGYISFVRELPNGDLLAGFNIDSVGAILARLDPTGEVLWSKSYFQPNGLFYDCIVESDSSYIIIGATDHVAFGASCR